MNENLKQKAGLVYNVVESVILGMSVGLMVWVTNTVITQGQHIERISVRQDSVVDRVTRLETVGSPSLIAHERADDTRVLDLTLRIEKVEAAIIVLQATPGELKAISVSLQNLREGQQRIEDRLNKTSKP